MKPHHEGQHIIWSTDGTVCMFVPLPVGYADESISDVSDAEPLGGLFVNEELL